MSTKPNLVRNSCVVPKARRKSGQRSTVKSETKTQNGAHGNVVGQA